MAVEEQAAAPAAVVDAADEPMQAEAAAPPTIAPADAAPAPLAADAAPAADAPAPPPDGSGRPIILRLDCGSLIGDAQAVLGAQAAAGGFSADVVVVDPLQACSLGRATAAQLKRLDGYIADYGGRVPNLAALNRSALKSHNPYAQEVRTAGLGGRVAKLGGGGLAGERTRRRRALRRRAGAAARRRAAAAAADARASPLAPTPPPLFPLARPSIGIRPSSSFFKPWTHAPLSPPSQTKYTKQKRTSSPPSLPLFPETKQGLRTLKRQKSLANGDDGPGGAYHAPVSYGGMHGAPSGAYGAPGGGGGAGGGGAGGGGAGAYGGGEFLDRCRDVLGRVLSECGPREMCYHVLARDVFYRPVSETFPTIADDYYSKVERPITFGEIERKLTRRTYEAPQPFADDMRRVFANCRRYNPRPEDLVHRLGARLEGHFEQTWAASGLAAESRARRATAGLAAARFNPCDEEALAAAAAAAGGGGYGAERAPSDYAGGGGGGGGGGSARRPAKPGGASRGLGGGGGGGGRPSRSHGEASSYGGAGNGGGGGDGYGGDGGPSLGYASEHHHPQHQHQHPQQQHEDDGDGGAHDQEQQQLGEDVPHDVLTEVAGAIASLGPDELEHAVGLLNEGVVVVAPDGETELDFARITRASLFAVDAYIRRVQGAPPRAQQHQGEGGGAAVGVTVEQDESDDRGGGGSDDE